MAQRGMSQSELVRASGVSAFTIRKVMQGVAGRYQAAKLAKISTALGGPAEALRLLYAGETPPAAPSPSAVSADELAAAGDRLAAVEAELREVRAQLARLNERFLPAAHREEGSEPAAPPARP